MELSDAIEFAKKITTLEDWDTAFRILKEQRNRLIASQANQIFPGQKVTFEGRRGISYSGIVLKVNQKSVKIDCGKDGKWNVSPLFVKGV